METFIDLFAGIGGFRRGLEQNDLKCVGSCEINEMARRSYSIIHDEKFEDILVDVNEYEKMIKHLDGQKVDIICGGFPCQPFSRSGKREGFKDKNKGNLFFSTMTLVDKLQPETVLLENVKGLLTIGEKEITEEGLPNKEVDKGSTFKDILHELNLNGYDVEWQVINSAHFIEQKRERVFIHAKRKNGGFKRIFPFPGSSASIIRTKNFKEEIGGLILELQNSIAPNGEKLLEKKEKVWWYKIIDGKLHDWTGTEHVYGKATPFMNWGMMIDGNIVTARINHRLPKKNELILANKLLANDEVLRNYRYELLTDEEIRQQKISKASKVWKSGNKMGAMSFPDSKSKPSRTLTAGATGRELMIIEIEDNSQRKYRRLTDLEYLRLQGFTDDDYAKLLHEKMSKNQLKKQAGNAVTVDVIREIGKRLKEVSVDEISN